MSNGKQRNDSSKTTGNDGWVKNPLFALLRIAIWPDRPVEDFAPLTDGQWETLYETAKKQTLCGVLFDGCKRLPLSLQPNEELRTKWAMRVLRIEEQNHKMNRAAAWVTRNFAQEGFRSCILKGQGVALFYPTPLHRQAGDTDIWVEGGRKRILSYLRSVGPTGEVVYHHIGFPIHRKLDIEVHTTPTWMNNPLRNRKLQRILLTWSDKCFSHRKTLPDGQTIYTPCDEINQLFLLIHLYRHLFDEGVGLRQLTDYALMMERTFTPETAVVLRNNLRQLGLLPFAGAVFYVLTRNLGYPMDKVPVELDDKRGETFIKEMLAAGNFGQYDERNRHRADESVGRRFLRKVKRNLRFLIDYPDETLSTPLFKIGHYVWRKANGFI